MFRLDGRIALVTGAATGIGQAIAVAMAANGADIAVTDRHLETLTETESRVLAHRRRVFKTELDVRVMEQIGRSIVEIEQSFGAIDILVNNAGINRPASTDCATVEEWDDHFNTNVRGAFFLLRQSAQACERVAGGASYLSQASLALSAFLVNQSTARRRAR
ncbi:MAG: short-chain dehydrogenase/reductase [Edaphobacter sp.]|nr:short-chain dehydrogenase/reductase [Edaphobacter sp.]